MISCERYFLLFKRRQDNTFFCLPSYWAIIPMLQTCLNLEQRIMQIQNFLFLQWKKAGIKKFQIFIWVNEIGLSFKVYF
jgi:hypothetical protein